MEIHILLAGVEIGPFSEEQLRRHLADGLVSPADPAKHEGMKEWEAVEVLLAKLPPEIPVTNTSVPSPAPESSPPPPLTPPPAEQKAPSGPPRAIVPSVVTLQPIRDPSPSTETPNSVSDETTSSTSTQKIKRRASKIVIQPILPLTSTSPVGAKGEPPKAILRTPPTEESTSSPTATKKMVAVKAVLPGRHPVEEENVVEKRPPPLTQVARAQASASRNPPPLPASRAKPALKLPIDPLRPKALYVGTAIGLVLILIVIVLVVESAPSGGKPNESNPTPSAKGTNSDESILTSQPHTADEFNKQGAARQSKGDLDGAISDYNQAITLEPNNVIAFYQRGLAQRSKQDWKAALADFNQAIILDPRHAETYSNRGFVKQCLGDPDGAIADYTQALFINPKIVTAYYNRALIKSQRGDVDGAIADYSEALTVDPKIALAFYNRGRLKMQKNDFDGAALDFSQTLELDPTMAEAYYYRGNAKNNEGNADGAVADYTQALGLNPKIAGAYGYRGAVRQSKGDFDGALDDYTQALALNPKMAAIYYNRGLIREQKGDLPGAIADSTQALQLNPKDAQSYCNRGLAKLGMGDLDGAQVDLKTFCELAPRDNDADYARLYLWLIATKENPQGHADHDLITAISNDWNSPPDSLATKIAKFLLGHFSESDLLLIANDQTQDQATRCKVWYFAGMKRLFVGQKPIAIDYLYKAVTTGKPEDCEYLFAKQQLRELEENPQSPPAAPAPSSNTSY
jgi:tetratricopeptide (TPR) repeat protein